MNDVGKTGSMLNTTVKRSYKKLFDFLKDHTKKPTSDSSPTHTRIGDKDSKIAGGAYYIPDEKWDMFMDLYWNDVIQK